MLYKHRLRCYTRKGRPAATFSSNGREGTDSKLLVAIASEDVRKLPNVLRECEREGMVGVKETVAQVGWETA